MIIRSFCLAGTILLLASSCAPQSSARRDAALRADRREDIADQREDIRDARTFTGRADRLEDIRDHREDVRDRRWGTR